MSQGLFAVCCMLYGSGESVAWTQGKGRVHQYWVNQKVNFDSSNSSSTGITIRIRATVKSRERSKNASALHIESSIQWCKRIDTTRTVSDE
jgi:hypothetical protein